MDHLVIIVIVTNHHHHHRVEQIIDRMIIVHILNNVDEDERQVVVQLRHRLLVHLPRLLPPPSPVQHQDHIPDHRRLRPDQVIPRIIVIIENERMSLELKHRKIKMMKKIIVQV